MSQDHAGEYDEEVPGEEEVERRLAELGMPESSLFRDAVRVGHEAGQFVTPAYPITARGVIAFNMTVGSLRTSLAERRWRFDDRHGIAKAISPSGDVIVAVASGDAQTGRLRGDAAQTRRPRGPASVRLIRRNAQLELGLEVTVPVVAEQGVMGPTWYLLYYFDLNAGEIRCELSLARGVRDDGTLIDWVERLVLYPIVLGDEPEGGVAPTAPVTPLAPIDVPVVRRLTA